MRRHYLKVAGGAARVFCALGLVGLTVAVTGCPERAERPGRETSRLFAHPGACSQCHGAHPGRAPERAPDGWKVATPPRDMVCTSGACHEDLVVELRHIHAPLGVRECSACHVPHSSDQPHLLARNEATVCASCHERLISCPAATPGAVTPDSGLGACSSCHAPHGGAEAFFLHATPPLTASSKAEVRGERPGGRPGERHGSQTSTRQGEVGFVR